MAINPIYTTRISHNLQTSTLNSQVQANALVLFELQQQLATGRRVLRTGDDPVGTTRIVQYEQLIERQQQILTNVRSAESHLSATDDATSDISSLLIQAAEIASQNIGSFASADERAAAATIIDGIIGQLQVVGNRQFNGRFVFGGRLTDRPPLDSSLGRIAHFGDDGDLLTRVAGGASFGFDSDLAYNLTIDELFDLRQSTVQGFSDLNPAATAETRVADIDGALGLSIRLGTLRLTEHSGPDVTFDVDLAGATTLGEVATRIVNAATAAGSTLGVAIIGNHLRITSSGGNTFDVADTGSGQAAADLGIATTAGGPALDGADIRPRLTATTPISALLDGAGLTLPSGVQITNAQLSATITFGGVTTVQELLNRLNGAGVGISARINEAGNGLEVINLVSGTELSIGENGGTDATVLGIRTLHAGTSLSSLNSGLGVTTVAGNDLTITDGNGVSFNVDLDGATTIGDVITKINAAAGVAGSALTAGLATVGNGLVLSQGAGTQNITVARANFSPAIDGLGFSTTAGTPTSLAADDNSRIRASGVLSALYELRDGLMNNDTRRIGRAGEEISRLQRHVASIQGTLGARSAAIRQRAERTEDVVAATRVLLSEVRDVDFAEAATRFSQAQTALQANLQSGGRILDLSLLDFLR